VSSWSLSRTKGITFGLSGTSDSSELVPGGFTKFFGTVDRQTFYVGKMSTGGRTSDPPLKPTGAVFSCGGRALVAARSGDGRTLVAAKSGGERTAKSPLKRTLSESSKVETDSVSSWSSISSASSSVLTVRQKWQGQAPWVVWHLQQSKRRLGGQGHCEGYQCCWKE
jgi:hypothetical protein